MDAEGGAFGKVRLERLQGFEQAGQGCAITLEGGRDVGKGGRTVTGSLEGADEDALAFLEGVETGGHAVLGLLAPGVPLQMQMDTRASLDEDRQAGDDRQGPW
jgi:hypothetical protein